MYKHMMFTHLYLSMLLSVIETSIYLNLLSTLHKQSVDPHTYYHNYFIILLGVDIRWLELSYPSLFSLTLTCLSLLHIAPVIIIILACTPLQYYYYYYIYISIISYMGPMLLTLYLDKLVHS
jgi:hypothetical protein